MGKIIIKIPEDIEETLELNITYRELLEKLGLEKRREKKLIKETFNTLKTNKYLEKQLDEEWYNQ